MKLRWALLFAIVAALGVMAGTSVASRTNHRPRARCHPTRHHRCPVAHRRKQSVKVKTTPVKTTTTTTTSSAVLPRRLEVDENDQGQDPQPYSLAPSHNPVGAGTVQFNVYNFGQDQHTFAVLNSAGQQLAFAQVPADQPDSAVPVSVNLPPGTYTLECTLQNHAALGMRATLVVK